MKELKLIKKTELNGEIWYVVEGKDINTTYHHTLEKAKEKFDIIKDNLQKYGSDQIEVLESYTINKDNL